MTASPDRPGRVPVGWVATVMALLLLAASLLFPVQSGDRSPAVPAGAGQEFCDHGDPGHRVHAHQLGTGWTPNPTPRARPAVEPAVRALPECAFPVTAVDAPPGVDPAGDGVPRV